MSLLADRVFRKIFWKKGSVSQLSDLDDRFKQFIEDSQRLEEDWHEKVSQVKKFLETWDKGDLRKLGDSIRVIRKVEGIEHNLISKDGGLLKKLLEILDSMSQRYGKKSFLWIFSLKHPSEKYAEDIRMHATYFTLKRTKLDKINALLDKLIAKIKGDMYIWKRLERNLLNQYNFVKIYSEKNVDIGITHYHIQEFIDLLKEEASFLGVQKSIIEDFTEIERLLKPDEAIGERKKLLESWGFPSTGYHYLEGVLLTEWETTISIKDSIPPDSVEVWFKNYLPYTEGIVQKFGLKKSWEFLVKVANTMSQRDFFLMFSHLLPIYGKKIKSLNELLLISQNKNYWTIQGLNSMGFLCCHVTNAYWRSMESFTNITNDINNAFDYNPSISVISPEIKQSLVVTHNDYKIGGSIGTIYDYGYIYESYPSDIGTTDFKSWYSNKAYRTGRLRHYARWSRARVDAKIAIDYSKSKYNEMLIRKWTVSAIFYSKGCLQGTIDKLIKISNEYSFKEYINGAYWYRTTKKGVPEKINKVFPIFEIDLSDNTWRVVHMPENPNYEIAKDEKNYTWVAVKK